MKKKNLIMTLAVVSTMGMVLTGCGGDKPDKVTEDVQKEQETDTVEVEIKENGETVSDEQAAVGDYLSEHGITISPQGTYVMKVADFGSDTLNDHNVTTTIWTEPDDENGYSVAFFKAHWDTSESLYLCTTCNIYDRYTGCNLITLSEDKSFDEMQGAYIGDASVNVDGNQYDCSYIIEWGPTEGDVYKVSIIFKYPSEYDGVVFSVGANTESRGVVGCTEHTSCKLADHPEWIENDLYFTVSDK